jgi:membrane fusion protein (multidrug efflux system)
MANLSQPTDPDSARPSFAKRLIFTILGAVLLIGAIVGVKVLFVMKQISSFHPPPPPVVTDLKVPSLDWSNRIDTVGNLRAWRGTDLSAEVAGMVRTVNFRSGQSVGAGAVLFELNADAERAQLKSLEAAADLARTTLARDREQLAASAVSQATIDADEASLKSTLAQADQQRALIEKKTIRAPFAGRTGITLVNPGLYVNAGDKVVTLQSIDTLYLDFYVPQRELGRVRVGADVNLDVDAWPGRPFEGKVTAISSAVDAATRNVQVEATVRNPKHELLPGMFAKVGLMVGTREHYVTIPQAAVSFNPYGSSVFVVQSGKDEKGEAKLTAKEVFVTTGPTRGDQIAVLKGLQEGDEIVTSGQLKLKNGAALRIDNKVQPPNDPNPAPQEH